MYRGKRICLLVLSLLFPALPACDNNTTEQGELMNEKQLSAVGSKMNLTFPADTRLLGVNESHGIDDAVFLKVEISAAAWPKFLASSPFREGDFAEDKRYLLEPDQDWWDPSAPQKLPTAQTYLPGAKVLNMGVDKSNSQEVVVYLFWHAT
jgi:hypothetical protein